MSFADLIVHLCFSLNKFSSFYRIQSKGRFLIRDISESYSLFSIKNIINPIIIMIGIKSNPAIVFL